MCMCYLRVRVNVYQNNHDQFRIWFYIFSISSVVTLLLFPNVGGMTSMPVLAFIIILKEIVVSYLYSTRGDKTFIVHEYQYWSIQTYHWVATTRVRTSTGIQTPCREIVNLDSIHQETSAGLLYTLQVYCHTTELQKKELEHVLTAGIQKHLLEISYLYSTRFNIMFTELQQHELEPVLVFRKIC